VDCSPEQVRNGIEIHTTNGSEIEIGHLWRIILHEKLVSTHNMLVKRCADGCILRLSIPILHFLNPTARTERSGCHIGSNSWLIIVKAHTTRSVQHAEDLENIAITRVAMKLVPFERLASAPGIVLSITCSIEAQHQGLSTRGAKAGSKSKGSWLLHDHTRKFQSMVHFCRLLEVEITNRA